MKGGRASGGLFLIALLAAAGFALVTIPPRLAEQYRTVAAWGQPWVAVYFTLIAVGAALLIGSAGWIVSRVWRTTKRKRQRADQRRKNPSELGAGERTAEIQTNLDSIFQLHDDPHIAAEVKQHLEPMLREFSGKRETNELEIVVFGTISSGKSSLLNAIDPRLQLRVSAVSAETEKGKHTTTTACLLPLAGGGYVVDTPGIRQFELWDVVAAEVANFYRELRPYLSLCRFPNCTHTHESYCAVKDAVADGRIDVRRYESYCHLRSGE